MDRDRWRVTSLFLSTGLTDISLIHHIFLLPLKRIPVVYLSLNLLFHITPTVHNCDDIKTIESIFLCIVIVGAFSAIFTLAGSIIGCMATCCARPQVTIVTPRALLLYVKPMTLDPRTKYANLRHRVIEWCALHLDNRNNRIK